MGWCSKNYELPHMSTRTTVPKTFFIIERKRKIFHGETISRLWLLSLLYQGTGTKIKHAQENTSSSSSSSNNDDNKTPRTPNQKSTTKEQIGRNLIHCSIISPNINVLNSPRERHILTDYLIQKTMVLLLLAPGNIPNGQGYRPC